MLSKKIMCTIGIVILFTGISYGQNLSESVSLAMKHNNSIKAARETVVAAAQRASSVYRSTLPALDFGASYTHVTDVARITIPGTAGNPGREIQAGVFDSYETGLNLNYAVFTGYANQSRIQIEKMRHQISENSLSKTQKEIAYAVIAAYRQIQILDFDIKSTQSAQKRAEIQKHKLNSLFHNGMILPLDTLSITLSVLNYKQKLISFTAHRENMLDYLAILAGQKIAVSGLNDNDYEMIVPSLNLDEVEDFNALQLNANMISYKQKLVRSAFFPKVRLQAALKYAKPGVDMFANEWMTYGVVGLGLQWNIFSWNSDRMTLRAEKANYQKNTYLMRAARDRLETEFRKTGRELKTFEERADVLKEVWHVAEQKMKTLQSQSENGVVSISDFKEANQELTEAEMLYRQQLVRIAFKQNELEYKSGKAIKDWRLL